ncbi:hypothetical protein LQW54_010656 [Pestalotiopsis sp. IQ-011]
MGDFFDQDMASIPLIGDAQGYVNPYQHTTQMSPLAGITGTFAPTLHGAQQLYFAKLDSMQKDVAPVSEIRVDVTFMRREVQVALERLDKVEGKIDALGQAIEQIQLSLAGSAGRFEDLQTGLRAFSADCHAWFARLGKESDEVLNEPGGSGAGSAPLGGGGGTPGFDFITGQHVTDMNDQINSFHFG